MAAGPMKMRATLGDGFTDVRVLMTHPMATEQQTKGQPHFIQNLTVKLNGRTVVEGQISQAVSRNPVFSFRVKGVKSGDKLEITWLDNKGDKNQTETAIA